MERISDNGRTALYKIGHGFANTRPDLNDKLSDDFLQELAIWYLYSLFYDDGDKDNGQRLIDAYDACVYSRDEST